MNTETFSLDKAGSAGQVAINLPEDVASMLKKVARAHRKPVAELIREWLEDQADGREAERRWKTLKSGKTEAIPADEVYKRLGI